jgi:hypothetical protein
MRRLAMLCLLPACAAEPSTRAPEAELDGTVDTASPNDASAVPSVCQTRNVAVRSQATGLLGSGVFTVESLSPAGLER